MFVVINPGTGPAQAYGDGILLKNAVKNIRVWCKEMGHGYRWERLPKRDEEGRYGFLVTHRRPSRRRGAKPGETAECRHTVDMPGLPLAKVRFTTDQNAWDFPRMYVDDSSWLWAFSNPHDCDDEPADIDSADDT